MVKTNGVKQMNVDDYIGTKFGRLTPISKITGLKNSKYVCVCECGRTTEVTRNSLRTGGTKSCGCLNKELASKRAKTHGQSGTPIHNVWNGMITRCHNDKSISYKYYGGQGTLVCNDWRNSFKCFYDWAINNGYKIGLQIDRINPYGNYEPSNCRWVTRSINAQNKKPFWTHDRFDGKGISFSKNRNKWVASIKYEGKIHSKRFDTKEDAIAYRKKLVERAILKDAHKANKLMEINR